MTAGQQFLLEVQSEAAPRLAIVWTAGLFVLQMAAAWLATSMNFMTPLQALAAAFLLATYLASGPTRLLRSAAVHILAGLPAAARSKMRSRALGFCVPAAKCTIINVNNKPAE